MKFTYLVFLCFFFLSFNPFQHQTNIHSDPIVGEWKIEKIIYIYSNASPSEQIPLKCSSSKIFSYKADGTLKFYLFEYNSDTEDCTIPSMELWEGTWERSKNGNYIRTLTYKQNKRLMSSHVDSVGRFIFSDHNSKMTQILNYEESGIAIESSSGLIEEQIFFKKVL